MDEGSVRAGAADPLAARIGTAARERLRAACVGIAGAGGLGSNIAVMLARSGIGALRIVDFDAVEPIVAAITPVPAGVGSVPTAVLASHVVRAAERTAKW